MKKKKKTSRSRALERSGGDGGGLMVMDSDYVVLQESPEKIKAVLKANVGPTGLTRGDLQRIKMPTGGATNWSVENIRGKEESVDEIEGIIVEKRPARVFWSEPIEKTGGSSPPDCASDGGDVGVGNPGGNCHRCPMNVFGSDVKGGKGKACKELNLLFLLTREKLLPKLLAITPGSLTTVRKYLLALVDERLPFYAVTTKFRLERAKNSSGISFAKVKPVLGRELEDEEIRAIQTYAENITPALEQCVDMSRGEVEAE